MYGFFRKKNALECVGSFPLRLSLNTKLEPTLVFNNMLRSYSSNRKEQSNILLKLTNVSKRFTNKLILDDVSFDLKKEDKIILVGENGVGKSTLIEIMLGKINPDEGMVSQQSETTVGYMPQDLTKIFEEEPLITIKEHLVLSSKNRNLIKIIEREKEIDQKKKDSSINSFLMSQLKDEEKLLAKEFNNLGGYKFFKILSELNLKNINPNKLMAELSGGEKAKVTLAGLAIQMPDILILDEPTNHLDFYALAWLERFLANYPNAVFLITHDRQLITQSKGKIVELTPDNHQLFVFNGSYDFYLKEKERQYQRQLQLHQEQKKEIETLENKIAQAHVQYQVIKPPKDNFKLGYDLAGGRKERAGSRIAKQNKVKFNFLQKNLAEVPQRRNLIKVQFEPLETKSSLLLQLSNISHHYSGHYVLNSLSKQIYKNDRIVIVGPNGSGKSTLLKIISGVINPSSGDVQIASDVKFGYLDQEQESLDLNELLINEIFRDIKSIKPREEIIEEFCVKGFFGRSQLKQPVGHLSVGQRRKLQLAKIIASGANFLVLDEPTNHIDLMSAEQLEQALFDFKGTILSVSHDRWFIKKIAHDIWDFYEDLPQDMLVQKSFNFKGRGINLV